MSDLTPEAVKAALDLADLLDAWGEVNQAQGREGQSKDMAKAATSVRTLDGRTWDHMPAPSRAADGDAAGATRPAGGGTLGRDG